MGRSAKEVKISAYLRLAELCSPSESDKKVEYMKIVENLLKDDFNSFDETEKKLISEDSIYAFVRHCEHSNLNVCGKTVFSVYEKHINFCDENNNRILEMNEFSKQFQRISVYSTKRRNTSNGSKVTIYVSNNSVLSFIEEVGADEIENEPTKEVFLRYSAYCIQNGFKPLSNIGFSKQICRYLNFSTKQKKTHNKKYQIFCKGCD